MDALLISPIDLQPLSGTVSTVIRQDTAVVWIQGEIDLAMSGELARVSAGLPSRITEVVIDTSTMTFADCTFVAFVAKLREHRKVRFREPACLLRQLLSLAGLDVALATGRESSGGSRRLESPQSRGGTEAC